MAKNYIYATSLAVIQRPTSNGAANVPQKFKISHAAVVIVAPNEKEAIRLAESVIFQMFPLSSGYDDHSVDVMKLADARRGQKPGVRVRK